MKKFQSPTGDYYFGHDHLYSPAVLFKADGSVGAEALSADQKGNCCGVLRLLPKRLCRLKRLMEIKQGLRFYDCNLLWVSVKCVDVQLVVPCFEVDIAECFKPTGR